MSCLCASYGLNYHLKCSFKSILDKKHQKFFLRDRSFVCPTRNVYRSTHIPRNLPCPEDFLVAPLNRNPKIRIFYGMFRTENCNQSFPSWTNSVDRMGLSLNLLLVYLAFRPKSGGVPLDENLRYLQNYS